MLALGGSLVLALTLMPALCSFLLLRNMAERDNWVLRFAKMIYSPVLSSALRWRWLVVLSALVLFGLALVIFNRLAKTSLPSSMKALTP